MLIEAIQNEVEKSSAVLGKVRSEIARVIVGQQDIIDRLLIGIIANGHILIEGVPGLAKTLIISSLASVFDASYSVFANFILADEINRAPSKVQSALLEAMQERQVTLGDNTFILPKPFFVMATQNPIEQEGTYPLPEAQVDRFFMKLKIKYPSYDEERIILERMVNEQPIPLKKVLSPADIESMREVMYMVYMEEKLKDYILHLINSTRHPERYPRLNDLKGLIEFGASPRATIYLARAAKANAYISGRAYVIPDDIKAIARDVLRHRIILSYEAEAEEITTEDIINRILDEIEVP